MKYRIVTILLITTLICGVLPLINLSTTVKASPVTLHVPADHPTITEAIGAANPGDTILVDPGTYYEAVDINKQLNITSTGGSGVTFIDGTGLGVLPSAGLVKITAAGDVTFSGFTVQQAPADASGVTFGILSQSSVAGVAYTISHNNVYGTNDPGNANDYGFYSQSDSANVVFTHNLITRTGANNIVFEVHTGATEISYNTLDAGVYGSDAVFFMTYNGLDVTTLQNVSYNTFDMSTGGPFDYDHRASAISFNTPDGAYGALTDADFTNVVIQGNIINNLESYRRGIGFWNGGGSGGGIIAPVVEDNTMTGVIGSTESYGIDFIATGSAPNAATNATVVNNLISNTAYGIYLRTAGCAPGAEMHYNNIAGNTVGLDNTVGPSVDAQYNWWGDPAGPYNPTSNPSGTGNPVTDDVNYSHYLTSPFGAHLYIDPTPVNEAPGDSFFDLFVTLRNFTNLMGFDIKLTWDNSLITKASVVYATYLDALWGAGNWGIAPEESGAGYYELAAFSTSAAASDTGASVLFKVTFHIEKTWIFPLSTPIHFDLVKLSDNATPVPNSIPATVTDGTYTMSAMVPGIEFKLEKWNQKTSTWDPVATGPLYHFERDNYFHVDVYVANVVSLTGYDLTIDFTPGAVAFQGVETWGIFGSGTLVYTPGTPSVIQVSGSGSPWSGSEGVLFVLRFHVEFAVTPAHIWKNGNLNSETFPISITDATLSFGSLGTIPISEITLPLALSIEVDFIRGDLDCNGAVTMADIGEVAYYYGQAVPPGPAQYDLTSNNFIDIYDIVTIATNYQYGTDP